MATLFLKGRTIFLQVVAMALLASTLSCASASSPGRKLADDAAPMGAAGEQEARYTIRSASLDLEVSDVAEATTRIEGAVKAREGLIESSSNAGTESASISIRVPSSRLRETVEELSRFGDIVTSRFSEQDVSEQYTDSEAKLANLRALRDRLRTLLDRATGVKDVLAIEEQMTRVQTELDQLESRFKLLNSKIAMSTLEVSLEKSHIPGPLGAVLQAGAWVIEKLFVLN